MGINIRLSFAALLLAASAQPVSAQLGTGIGAPLSVNSEFEEYLRFAQTMDTMPADPWSLRGFTREQSARLARIQGRHPWSGRKQLQSLGNSDGVVVEPLGLGLVFNSAFPMGSNDGPVWAGKGATFVARAGVSAKWKVLSIRFAPVFFRAQNAGFPLLPNGRTGKLRFADGQFPDGVDRPQRFGDTPYQQLDPGESTVSVDAFHATLGVSTATQAWGPSGIYQFLLGNNAGGYPHLYFGSESPINIGIARVHARVVWGMLEQSAFSFVGGPQHFVDGAQPGRRRFTSGMIATVQPRGTLGLELGAARFFHSFWRDGGPIRSDFTAIFQNFFKRNLPLEQPLPGTDNNKGVRDNQLFSLFTRWVVPGTGFEVYGEYGRDDHSYDLRDFFQEPDHGGASRMLGLRKMWRNGYALRAESINYEEPQLTIVRPEGSVYLHYVLRQGHTNKGQPLGADAGMGSGAATSVKVDHYTERGRFSVTWARTVARETGEFYLTGIPNLKTPDVLHTIALENFRFHGASDLFWKVSLTDNLNRYFRSDAFNLGAEIGTSIRF